ELGHVQVFTLLGIEVGVEDEFGHTDDAVHRVRISWLMEARKSFVARLTASASSLVWVSSNSMLLRSELSRKGPSTTEPPPVGSSTRLAFSRTQTRLPSLRLKLVSKLLTSPAEESRAMYALRS